MSLGGSAELDRSALLALNQQYIRSVQESDAGWFQEWLADDFRCSLPDGSLIDKPAFLERTARPPTLSALAVHEVMIRLLGDVAIVHARTTFTTFEGRPAGGRYTDVWVRRNGRWVAAAAHVTRCAAPGHELARAWAVRGTVEF